nr:MAG TPA_asm: hypothetical protein [Caudoviricetes sp.]
MASRYARHKHTLSPSAALQRQRVQSTTETDKHKTVTLAKENHVFGRFSKLKYIFFSFKVIFIIFAQ